MSEPVTDSLIIEQLQNRLADLSAKLNAIHEQRAGILKEWVELREKAVKLGFSCREAPYVPFNTDKTASDKIKSCEGVLDAMKHPHAINFDGTPAHMYRVTKVTVKRIYYIYLHYGYYNENNDLGNLRVVSEKFINQDTILPPFSPDLTTKYVQSNQITK